MGSVGHYLCLTCSVNELLMRAICTCTLYVIPQTCCCFTGSNRTALGLNQLGPLVAPLTTVSSMTPYSAVTRYAIPETGQAYVLSLFDIPYVNLRQNTL